MAVHSVTFHGVSPGAYHSVRKRLLTLLEGVEVAEERDALEVRGVRGRLHYDESSGSVTAVLHEVPAVVSRGYVTGWLHDAFNSADF